MKTTTKRNEAQNLKQNDMKSNNNLIITTMRKATKEIITFKCEYCDKIFAELCSDYIAQNSNASDLYIYQERLKHEIGCPKAPQEEIFCDTCGGLICEYPSASEILNENGLGRWVLAETEWHNKFCPGTEEEQEEAAWVNKQFGERKMSKEEFKYYYSLHRNSESREHYSCFHYMQNLTSQDISTTPEKIARIKRAKRGRIRK